MKSSLSSGKSSAGERNADPALLIRMSTLPKSRSTLSASATTAVRTRNVEQRGDRFSVLFRDRRVRRLGSGQVHVGDHDRDADLRKTDRHGSAKPAAAAGNDGNPAFQIEQICGIAGRNGQLIGRHGKVLNFRPASRSTQPARIWSGSTYGWLSAQSRLSITPKPADWGSGCINPAGPRVGCARLSAYGSTPVHGTPHSIGQSV